MLLLDKTRASITTNVLQLIYGHSVPRAPMQTKATSKKKILGSNGAKKSSSLCTL